MSNRLFQGIIHQMKDSIDRTIGVIDETSVVIACSDLGKIGEVDESVNSEALISQAPFVAGGFMPYLYRATMIMPRNTLRFSRYLLLILSSITTRNTTAPTSLKM